MSNTAIPIYHTATLIYVEQAVVISVNVWNLFILLEMNYKVIIFRKIEPDLTKQTI